MFFDTRDHPHWRRRQVWIQHPAEDSRSGEAGVCGFTLRSLYGLRDAGMNVEQLTREVMDKIGFTCGLWSFLHLNPDRSNRLPMVCPCW